MVLEICASFNFLTILSAAIFPEFELSGDIAGHSRMKPEIQKRIWDELQVNRIGSDEFKANFRRLDKILGTISRLSFGNPSDVKVLNIGIGNAYFENILLSSDIDIYTLDPSESAIMAVKEKFSFDDDHAKCGSAQDISFPENYFDFVVMSEVLEHLSDEIIPRAFKELQRVLKRRGYFIGTVPNNEDLIRNTFTCRYCGKTSHRVGHLRIYTVDSLREILKKYFEVDEIFSFRGMFLNTKGVLYFHWIDLPYKIVRIFRKNTQAPHQIAFNIFFVARNTR